MRACLGKVRLRRSPGRLSGWLLAALRARRWSREILFAHRLASFGENRLALRERKASTAVDRFPRQSMTAL